MNIEVAALRVRSQYMDQIPSADYLTHINYNASFAINNEIRVYCKTLYFAHFIALMFFLSIMNAVFSAYIQTHDDMISTLLVF